MKVINYSHNLLSRRARQVLYLILGVKNRKKRLEVISHKIYKNPLIDYVIVPDIKADEKDVCYAERLLKAYHLAIKDYQSPEYDLWAVISHRQAKFLALLKDNNPLTLAQYLCNMNREDATIGTIQGNEEYDRIISDPFYRRFIALMIKEKLISLAEALGVLPIENPEQGNYGKNIHVDAETVYKDICSFIGHDITPPPIDGGLFKVRLGNALLSERDCTAIYTSYNMKAAKTVCEIGGGGGRACLWSKKFGVSEYSILDLPHINVVQGFYLLKSLPGAVSLFGESAKEVKILPCHILPPEKFDLILNQDSFPEMKKNTVLNYLHWIKDHTSQFLNINYESKPPFAEEPINIYELVKEVGGLRRVERVPYWLRKGYVMEKYSPLN